MLRSLGRCYLRMVALLVADDAAEVLPISSSCPPLTLLNYSPHSIYSITSMLILFTTEMGAPSTASARLEVNLLCLRSGVERAT
jgi:hypothetical protein